MTMIPPSQFESLSRLFTRPFGGGLFGGAAQVRAKLQQAALKTESLGEGTKPKAEDVLARVQLSKSHPFEDAAYILKGDKPQVVYERRTVGGFVGGVEPLYSKPEDLPAGLPKNFDLKSLGEKPAPKWILADSFSL